MEFPDHHLFQKKPFSYELLCIACVWLLKNHRSSSLYRVRLRKALALKKYMENGGVIFDASLIREFCFDDLPG